MMSDNVTKTRGRPATTGVIEGRFALSVGSPPKTVPDGWRWTPLLEVARLESGHTPSRKHPEYWDGDIPWIGIKDATENHGRTIYDTYQHTNELGIANSAARVLPKNTVCLSRTASVGYVIVMGRPMATSQDFVNWVCAEELIDYRYLKYILLAEKESMLSFASGTTHQTIYFPEVKAFHVCLPPIKEQHAIADVLSDLDAKIELNERMNSTLESFANMLFNEWFVKFRPMKEIVDIDTEGKPRGWEFEPLSSVCSYLNRGISPKYSEHNGVMVLNQRCIRNHWIDFSQARLHDQKLKQVAGRELEIGDVLVNSTGVGTLGRVAQILMLEGTTVVDSHVTVVRADQDKILPEYLGIYLMQREDEIERLGAGSTGQTELSRDRLGQLPILVSPLPLQARFTEVLKPINKQRVENAREIKSLTTIRNLLLPKLITGELRVEKVKRVLHVQGSKS